MLYDLDKLREHVKGRLSEKRYRHSVCVQKEAMRLALRHGADWHKAGVAGLLHDICKDLPLGAQLNYLRSCGILLNILALENPGIWHAAAGAAYIERTLGIGDGEIIDAVRYHTTGRREMTPLEQVVFVADLTSADRDYPDVAHMRALADKDLDEAVLYAVRHAVQTLVKAEKPLTADTWEAYNYYLAKCGAKEE